MKAVKPIFNHPSLTLLENCKTLSNIKRIHAQIITTGLAHHTFPLSRLLLTCARLPNPSAVSYALFIFHHIPNPTIFLCNTLLSSLSNRQPRQAFSLYNLILNSRKLNPTNFTYPSLIKTCASESWFTLGRALHAHLVKFLGPNSDPFVQASLIGFYSKCGKLSIARQIFDQITQPDLVLWNTILAAYAGSGRDAHSFTDGFTIEALFLFNQMQLSLIRPNEITLVAVLAACADLGALCQGIWVHTYIEKNDLFMNLHVGTTLINMYSKCGCLDYAIQVFDKMPQRDTSCYNAIIGGFAIHGHGGNALDLFKLMQTQGLRPDDVSLIFVMSACAHVGLVDEGRQYFNNMRDEYGIEPKIEHYGCLIDLLGRAGLLEEAYEVIARMPTKPNVVMWRSLLGACRVHNNVELGEFVVRNLVELEPEHSGNYVLLSNMYANLNRWDDVRRIRKVMKDRGINKMPGCSILEMDGAIHEFVMGDKSHPYSLEIYAMLDEMAVQLKAVGYIPSTTEVLFDVDLQEKEDALLHHSERLAIAFALIASEPGQPIRIMKNLRVCGDCHASTKLISWIYKREIIMRDRNRFHHFREGNCSCLDYW